MRQLNVMKISCSRTTTESRQKSRGFPFTHYENTALQHKTNKPSHRKNYEIRCKAKKLLEF